MAYRSLQHFIDILEKEGELTRIDGFVSPRLEITEIADRMVKNKGKALLFTNTGTNFPVFINGFASDRRMELALGVKHLDETGERIGSLFHSLTGPKNTFSDKLKMLPLLSHVASWMPRTVKGKGVCQEVVMEHPDLTKLPVLTCWPADGGPFITLPGVHTRDPESGLRNLGMYRMQVFGPDLTGMHWHLHKGSANHYRKYREMGQKMPVSVTLGGDPVYTYAATAPLPENIDEYLLAGFLRNKRVEMVKCLTNDLEVPSDVDFVIEGYVDPAEELILEGPFGDHTGFYSLAGMFPRFHVTCITHRRHAVYPATIVGVPPQEDGWIGKATEKIFLMPIKMTVAPEVVDMHMPVEGVFHNITLVSITKQYPGQATKIMGALWGAGQMMFNKIMVVTGADTKLTDYRTLLQTITAHTDPVSGIHFLRGPVDILDHASTQYAYGSKIGIDATSPLPGEGSAVNPLTNLPVIKTEEILLRFPEITGVMSRLTEENISLVIMAVNKNAKVNLRITASGILKNELMQGVKFVVFVDDVIDPANLVHVTWIAANNLDPVRDCFYIDKEPGRPYPCLFLDGTRKTIENDRFSREWPNVIVMDDATIALVDAKWDTIMSVPFIASPSLTVKKLAMGTGAVFGTS